RALRRPDGEGLRTLPPGDPLGGAACRAEAGGARPVSVSRTALGADEAPPRRSRTKRSAQSGAGGGQEPARRFIPGLPRAGPDAIDAACEAGFTRVLLPPGASCYRSALSRGAVAQLGERLNGIQEVDGSIPFSSTIDSSHSRQVAGLLRSNRRPI